MNFLPHFFLCAFRTRTLLLGTDATLDCLVLLFLYILLVLNFFSLVFVFFLLFFSLWLKFFVCLCNLLRYLSDRPKCKEFSALFLKGKILKVFFQVAEHIPNQMPASFSCCCFSVSGSILYG